MAEDEELTDADWHTLCDTLRGSIAITESHAGEQRAPGRWNEHEGQLALGLLEAVIPDLHR